MTMIINYYNQGYKDGWLHSYIGLTELRIPFYSQLPGYSQGYYFGKLAYQNGEPLQ